MINKDYITSIIVDEQNFQYSVTAQSGRTVTGFKGLNLIRFEKTKGENNKEILQGYLETDEERESRYEKNKNDVVL